MEWEEEGLYRILPPSYSCSIVIVIVIIVVIVIIFIVAVSKYPYRNGYKWDCHQLDCRR